MKNIRRIIMLARPVWGLLTVVTILITAGALLELVTPWILKNIIDTLESYTQKGMRSESFFAGPFQTIIGYIGLMFLVNVFGQFLSNFSSLMGDRFAGRIRKFLTETFFAHSLTLSQTYFDSELSGKIMSQLNRGVQVIADFFNTATNFIVPSFLQALFTIIFLAFYSPLTAAIVALLFPVYIWLTAISNKKWMKYQLGRNKYEDLVRGRLSESILNIRLVRGFNNQNNELNTVRRGFEKVNEFYALQSQTFHTYDFLRNMSLYIVLGAVYINTFYDAYRGLMSFGEVVLIMQLINQVRRPLFAMSFVLGRLQEAEAGSKDYFSIMELPSRELLVDTTSKTKKIIKTPTIAFDHVSFSYDADKEVLHDLSFTADKHQTIALVGKSGAGKTTITNLIMKFYDATSGTITMGQYPYSDLTATDVRQHIALVFQDHELFSTSIRDNVAYGIEATDEQIVEALRKAQAWDFVQELKDGIRSEIGERGVKLSGGQKQRIQIARAILKDTPILILNEATSSLDAQSESQVQEALEVLMKDRLVLVIAHRFSTIRNADRILVLDHGKIIDQGTPQELATRTGIYKDLLTFQVEGNKKLLESFELH